MSQDGICIAPHPAAALRLCMYKICCSCNNNQSTLREDDHFEFIQKKTFNLSALDGSLYK